jgi:hypothetical protein
VRSKVLQGRLATLVLERQRLRDTRASAFVLEQNRIDIVQTQLELSRAFLSEHLEPRVAGGTSGGQAAMARR